MHRLSVGCLLFVFLYAEAFGQTSSFSVPGVLPTKSQDCVDLSARWYQKVRELDNAISQCSASYRASEIAIHKVGVPKPACKETEYMFLRCASVSNQRCAVTQQKEVAVSQCNNALAAYQRAERDKKSTASRIAEEYRQLTDAREKASNLLDKGPMGYAADRLIVTPQDAASRFHDAVKEAARTTGAPGADSQPQLNRVGEASDRLFRLGGTNQVATEIGSQSAAAARARMGDALNQLDGISVRSAEEMAAPIPSPAGGSLFTPPSTGSNTSAMGRRTTSRSDERLELDEGALSDNEDRSDVALRLEALRQLNDALRNTARQLTPEKGLSGRSSGVSSTAPKCWPREMKCSANNPNCTQGLPLCKY